MEELFKILGKILQFIFIILIFDWIFGGSRRAARNSRNTNNYDNNQSHNSYGDYSHTNKEDSTFKDFQKPSQLDEAYNVLGLNKNASLKEVKKKYIELAKKYHPDKNNSLEAQAKMTQINNAYDTILQHITN
ncbi:J domain-containing protein [Spiroplasma turonicum]|uniref:J domain-containing protein n=1 Tax=Spiroplasma turonicum TaxID=216946 RepID=A0A0K1P514_9MOLU|nr:J domain-containing protein [Spiroplasma turonicum]AKU79406.1 hypothetical protein STURON_00160 [Spiroplasma turonicum]ALX70427.1 hypothetical protein STURO_v1c01580 [Spiroplasma turonicum]